MVYVNVLEEARAAELEAAVGKLLAEGGRVGVVAATRAIRTHLASENQTKQ